MKSNYIAFFDVDETLINCKTMFDFLKFYYEKRNIHPLIGKLKYYLFKFKLYFYIKINKNREFLNNFYYKCYVGEKTENLMNISEEWFSLLKKKHCFNFKVIDELKKHQQNFAIIVFVSGSFLPCLSPIAKYFDVSHILAINLEEKEGKITGNIIQPQTIGEGKASAIIDFLKKNPQIDKKNCFAYGDHSSDLPMLQTVGNPVVVGQDKLLNKYAATNQWKTIQ